MLEMLLETTIISIAVGWFRKGKLINLESIPFGGWPFILAGFIIYALQIAALSFMPGAYSIWVHSNLQYLRAVSSILLIIGIIVSSRSAGFFTTASGIALNAVAMLINRGKMPVSPDALLHLGLVEQLNVLSQGGSSTHIIADKATRLYYLSDIIPVPIITPKVVSVGDILLAVGIFLIIQKYMILSEPLHS
jgi:hypothetical protein